MKEWKNKIYYSQCWEDPEILAQALEIRSDDTVLSVTSGGCNTLALALKGPKHIVALDVNPAQNYLLELKIAAIKSLGYEEFLKFIGISESIDRLVIFEGIKPQMSTEAQLWWSSRTNLIQIGILHIGKFEKYLSTFRNFFLPFIHSQETINQLSLLKIVSKQEDFYKNKWDNWRWKFLFKIFFSKFVMSNLGRNPSMFAHAGICNIGDHYLQKTKYALTKIPIGDNFFLEYILFGTYRSQRLMHPYLKKENFNLLKERVDRITIVTSGIKNFLSESKNDSFSKFNLSDIFEPLTESESYMIFTELLRTSKNGARWAYWNNLVQRKPSSQIVNIQEETKIETDLKKKDRVFFYGRFYVNTIHK